MIPHKIPLHDYQEFCKNFALTHPYCGLFLKMGLGKTAIILETLWEMNPTDHVLIIAPKTIARCTWQNEIEKWNIPIRTESLVVNQNGKQLTKKKRDQIYDTIQPNPYATVYFINRELIPDLVKRFPYQQWPFKTVIIDESQSFKSHSSQRFKALKEVRPYIQRLIELTGSPTPNGLMDLWSQIYLLDMGERLGRNITTYRNTFFDPGLIVNGYPVSYKPKRYMSNEQGFPLTDANGQLISAQDMIYDRIDDIVISMDNSFIQLPPITYHNVDVVMTKDEMKFYKKFAKESILELQDGQVIEAKNAAVLAAKLSQMASGSIYTDAKTHTYQVIHENKLEMCEYIINNTDTPVAAVLAAKLSQMASGSIYTDAKTHTYQVIHENKLEMCEYIINNTDTPVLIAYHFQSDKDMLLNYFKKQKMEAVLFDGSPEMQKAWNQGQYPIMLLQPASCGFGVNLQEGGSTLIWYTIPWSLEEYEQTNARIYRQGQSNHVFIHHLLTKHTGDPRMLSVVQDKDASQTDLLKAIEVTLSELEND